MDAENHSPLYWTVDTIYNNKIDNIEVYFFDAKGKPHFGTLSNESYTLVVKDKEGLGAVLPSHEHLIHDIKDVECATFTCA